MPQVSLDTSFLISFADPGRKHHDIAKAYFRFFLEKKIAMHLSVLAAGEFEVGQRVTDLPLQNFRVQPFNLLHAIRAAEFSRALKSSDAPKDPADARKVIANDVNIMAQADEEKITFIMTEDHGTMARYCGRLRESGLTKVNTVLLKDGFHPELILPVIDLDLELGNAGPEDWI